MRHARHLLRRARGFTLLELVVVILILSILGVVFVDRVMQVAEQAEKASMEYTANVINSALLFEFGNRIIKGRRTEIALLVESNPVNWLARKPLNYLGEFRDPPVNEEQFGNWYYDAGKRELVYLVRRGEHFVADRAGKKRVRYRVKLLYEDHAGEAGKSAVGAILEPVEPYRWF